MMPAMWARLGHWHRDPWMRAAQYAAAVALLVTPFRSSAGLRGAMLLVAAVALLVAHTRRGQLSQLWPPARALGAVLLVWLSAACMSAMSAPAVGEALGVWKRDMLTPLLGGLVFFALTRDRHDLLRWCWILLAGLVALTVMVVREPFDPALLSQNPAYLNVGWLTTWLVTLAPLMAVLILAPAARRSESRLLLLLATTCVCVASWMSGSRMVWLCYVAMLMLGMMLSLPRVRAPMVRRQAFAIGALLLAGLLGMLAVTMQFRAETQSAIRADAISFALNDHRNQIWREAWGMIMQRPWSGYGYGNESIGDLFSSRFADPWFREFVRQPHNVVLNHALQMGLMGALLLLGVFAALSAFFIRRLAGPNALARWAGICGLALVTGVLLRNTVDDFFSRHGVLFFGMACGALMGLSCHRPPLKRRGV